MLLAAVLATAIGCRKQEDPVPAAAPEASQDRPQIQAGRTHVIFLIIDTLRADKMGAYGFDASTSPELDQFAREGVRFRRAIAQCSWTRPSIGSMLTGRYPRSLGLYEEEGQRLGDSQQTLAELFHRHGYATLGVTANPNTNSVFGFDQGFDEYVDSRRIWPWMKVDADAPDGQKKTTYPGQLMTARQVFEHVWEWLKTHPDGPYFVQLNIMEMHGWGPRIRDEFKGRFEGKRDPRYLEKLRQASVDVGAFMQRWLSTEGLRDTLLVIASDHGEGLSDHPGIRNSRGHGLTLYETQLHVPLLFYHSEGALGRGIVVEQPVRNMDIMPTLADLFGFELDRKVDGVSLKPAIMHPDRRVALPELFVSETYFQEAEKKSVYSSTWNFYENLDGWEGMDRLELQRSGSPELGSRSNQIAEHPERAARMQAFLEAWERDHPKADPIVNGSLPDELLEQLRAIGYLH